MESKPWYQSRTIWANIIMIIAMITNDYAQLLNIPVEIQVLILSIANIIFRLITNKALDIKTYKPLAVLALTTCLMSCTQTGYLNGLSVNYQGGKINVSYDTSILMHESGVNAWINSLNTLSDDEKQKQLNDLLTWKANIETVKELNQNKP